MVQRILVTAACTVAALALSCGQTTPIEDPDTEVAARNLLVDVSIPSGDTTLNADSVHIYGLNIGGVRMANTLKAGASTGYSVTDEYGSSVELTCDSIAIYLTWCVTIGSGIDCQARRYVVNDVGTYFVEVNRYNQNLIEIDTNVIPIRQLFGETRVRVVNNLEDVTVTQNASSVRCSTLTLYGLRIDDALFSVILPGDTSAYGVPTRTGAVKATVDSVVGRADFFGPIQLVWTSVDTFTVSVDAFVSNTIVFDRTTSQLLSRLDSAVIRQ
jgi:hypothetical protein